MRDIIQKNIARQKNPLKRADALREGLQLLILKILDDGGFFKNICFVGGTALRILFDLRRFSEDMDFSLQKPNDPAFDFNGMLKYLVKHLDIYKLPVDTKTKQTGAVQSVFLRFKGVLKEFDIVKREGQKLAVKLEIDTNPPPYARFETRLLQKDFMFTVVHHDLATLFAGKTLAFLNRSYTKGRDLYDMIWFLNKGVRINRDFFGAGLAQQADNFSGSWSEDELKNRIIAKLDSLNMQTVIRDVQPFLDDPDEIRFFDASLIRPLFQRAVFS